MIAKLVQFISYGVKKCNQNIHQKRQSNIVHLKNKTKYFNSLVSLFSLYLTKPTWLEIVSTNEVTMIGITVGNGLKVAHFKICKICTNVNCDRMDARSPSRVFLDLNSLSFPYFEPTMLAKESPIPTESTPLISRIVSAFCKSVVIHKGSETPLSKYKLVRTRSPTSFSSLNVW